MKNVGEVKSLIKNSSKFQQISEHEKGVYTLPMQIINLENETVKHT